MYIDMNFCERIEIQYYYYWDWNCGGEREDWLFFFFSLKRLADQARQSDDYGFTPRVHPRPRPPFILHPRELKGSHRSRGLKTGWITSPQRETNCRWEGIRSGEMQQRWAKYRILRFGLQRAWISRPIKRQQSALRRKPLWEIIR